MTVDDENASQHVTSVLVTMLCNQREAFAPNLGDDQSRYLLVKLCLISVFYIQVVWSSHFVTELSRTPIVVSLFKMQTLCFFAGFIFFFCYLFTPPAIDLKLNTMCRVSPCRLLVLGIWPTLPGTLGHQAFLATTVDALQQQAIYSSLSRCSARCCDITAYTFAALRAMLWFLAAGILHLQHWCYY